MAQDDSTPPPQTDAAADARSLWCGRFHGVLSTHSSAEPGFPFGSVVPLCLDNGGAALLLLSHLAQHSRNLAADPRAALTLFDERDGDIQQGRRLTCLGRCEPYDDAQALTRWCRHFPRGRVYAEQLNFRLHRFEPLRCHYNGGFATARWLGVDRLLVQTAFDADTEAALARHLADAHADWLVGWCADAADAEGAGARVVGLDPLGVTLCCGERLLRLAAQGPLADSAALSAAIADKALRPWPGTATAP